MSAPPKVAPAAAHLALLPPLFPGTPGVETYAVLDGAAIPELLPTLRATPPAEWSCLYRGDLAPDLAAAAPYLVRLRRDTPFTTWLLTAGWGQHWGIFAHSPADFKAVRRHFRTFLLVKDPTGKQLYFRYYDPRVWRVYLPTCNATETATVFGPVQRYLLEDESFEFLLQFVRAYDRPTRLALRLFAS